VEGAALLDDDTMRLEFSAPRELHNRRSGDNVAALLAAGSASTEPSVIHEMRASAGAAQWRNRGAMFFKADVFGRANDDFLAALRTDPTDTEAVDGFVRTALVTGKTAEAIDRLRTQIDPTMLDRPRLLVALSKLQAASGGRDEALASARRAVEIGRTEPVGHEQLASLYADANDTVRLDEAVDALLHYAGENAAPTLYYQAVAGLLHGNLANAMAFAERGIGFNPTYAPLYDLAGAIYVKRGEVFRARWAFEQSLTFDAHDSTAYENLGLLALETGNLTEARNYFAEALWLVPDSRVAREGMARTR
jgi:Flp pilus assembly protein TadD